jgi:hypothetical protein
MLEKEHQHMTELCAEVPLKHNKQELFPASLVTWVGSVELEILEEFCLLDIIPCSLLKVN